MIDKPKKERRFLKTLGKIGEILIQEVLLKVGSNLIKRIGGKKNLPSILFLFLSISLFAQFPNTGNKQRLGFQTTADGLVWRGSISDTASIQPTTNQNAWLIIDTVNLKIYSFDFTSNVWGLVGGGTSGLTMPFDSITFNTAKDGTVGVGEVEYNDTQGSLIQGLKGGLVTNVIGQQLHQRVNNRTGATLAKGTVVYLSGSQGNRITVAKALGVTDAFSANTFGIVAESIANNQSGYIITEGLITGINTSALVEDSSVYLSPTVAGGLTSTKPQAPQHTVYIGVCVKSNAGSGELFVKIRNGQELDELHDVRITSPVNKASLYYLSSEGVWRDTTPTLLVSDTASMLANYASKAYADTSGRFYARQDFTNVSSSTLTWTQSDTLVVGGTGVVQVYRNGQILLPTQYTIPTKTTVVIGSTAYKLGENYTVIFPRGGGAGSGGGSGSLTSISGGTGILVSPNPITTTGTVSVDTSFLFTQSDTLSLNLTSRFALKLNAADTASLSTRIDAKGTGTVTSVGSGFGLLGGTITTTGTLRLDSAVVFNRIRDSIVDVAIGNDTIKILKQEYSPATTSVLTWTITPKFPIQLKAYILVFRNGQLLNNDQYNLTDTNKITIVSTSFKLGANYTVATVSGIGSVGSAQAGNPFYPEAGIALSTGSTWASSITNNSSNWNTAYNDKVNSLAVTGTTTKTITLTQQDGGTVSGNFSDNGTVTSVGMTVPTGLAISGQPITTTGTLALSYASGYSLPTDIKQNEWNTAYNDKINNAAFTGTDTKTLTLTQLDGGTLTPTFTDLQGVTGVTAGTGLTGGTITTTGTLAADTNFLVTRFDTSAMLLPYLRKADTTSMLLPYFRDNDTTLLNLTSRLNTKVNISDTASMLLPYFRDADTSLLNLTNRFAIKLNISDTLSMLSKYLRRADTTLMLLPYLRKVDTTSMLLPYFKDADTSLLNLTSRLNTKLNISDTTSMLLPYLRDADTSILNLSTRFNAKVNLSDTTNMLTPYLRKADTTNMLLPYFRDADTTSLNLTNRFNTKLNITDTTLMLSKYLRKLDTITLSNRINLKLNISDTTNMLLPYFRDADTTSLNLTSRLNTKLNISDTLNMLAPYLRKADTTNMLLPYLRKADTTQLNLTSRFATKLNYTDTSFLFTQSDTSQLNLTNRFAAKQNTLVSGTTIKTVNSTTLLGSGNLSVGTLVGTDTVSLSNRISLKFNTADTSQLNLTSRFATKLNYTDTSFLFTQSDTSQLNLTNRFAAKQNILNGTGFVKASGTNITYDNSSYLRTGLADSTYLKLTGGTLTGALNGTTATFSNIITSTNSINLKNSEPFNVLSIDAAPTIGSSNNKISTFNTTGLSFQTGGVERFRIQSDGTPIFYNNTFFQEYAIFSKGILDTFNLFNNDGYATLQISQAPNIGSSNNKISTINTTGLLFETAGSERFRIQSDGISIFSSQVKINNSNTVFNEDSGDFDTRIESDGNSNMVFVDASTNRVGIGTNTPSYTLDVTGTLGVTGAATLSDDLILRTSGGSRFQTAIRHYYEQQSRYAGEIQFLPSGSAGSALAFITNQSGFGQTERMRIDEFGRIGIGTNTPSYTLDVNGTLGVTGAVTLSTTTVSPTSLLGKDGSNVVGTVTTVAQTGLMTRNIVTDASTISGSELINVTHGLSSEPTAVLLTVFGSTNYILQVASKTSSTFTVQVKNYNGTPAINATLISFSWLAIK